MGGVIGASGREYNQQYLIYVMKLSKIKINEMREHKSL